MPSNSTHPAPIAGQFPDELLLELVHARLALDAFTGGHPDA